MNCRLKNTEHLLIDFFNTVDHQMAILELKDDKLIFNMSNRSIANLFNMPSGLLKCRPLDEFIASDGRLERYLMCHKSDPGTASVFTFECQLRSPMPTVWLECRIFPMTDGVDGSTFYGFVGMDITKRKKDQDELGKVKNQLYNIIDIGTDELETITESLQIILDKAPVMICCYDASGNVLFVNRAFEDTLGWSLAEARSNDMVASCYPDPVDRRRAMDFMMSDRADCQDFRMHCRNNDVLETSWANAPLTENIRIGIGLDITKRKQAEEAVRRLSRKTLEMLESDRQSVAKELHDSIAASLAAIKFSLEGRIMAMGEPPADDEMPFETIIAYLADTIKETKRISNGLRPLTLDDLGLLPTLAAYVRKLKEVYPHVKISQEIEIKEMDLPDPLKIVLYRVAQEALNNIHKHSGATKVSLRLTRIGNTVELEVHDNGCGFDVEEALERNDPLSGYGLRSMRERVEISDGTFRIQSSAGSGTRISAIFRIT